MRRPPPPTTVLPAMPGAEAALSGGERPADFLRRQRLDHPAAVAGFLRQHRRWDFLAAWTPDEAQLVADALARTLGLEALPLEGDLLPAADLLPRLPRAFAEANLLLPLERGEDGRVRLALADPLAAEALADAARLLGAPLTPLLAEEERLHGAIADAYDRLDGDQEPAGHEPESAEDLRDLANQAPVIRLVNRIFREALAAGASDIHLEPGPAALLVRQRVDGVLAVVARHPRRLAAALVSRVKILAELDIAERRLPLDGRIRLRQDGRDYDLRVATTPTVHGEGVVLRILDRGSVRVALDAIDLAPDVLAALRSLARRPHGVLLATGPTGAGKTTTLYSILNEIATPGLKVITVEDPVEYQLPGITQIAVDHRIGLGFAKVLRSVLRQDPDVVMVGEIRDTETARIAVQAALTGHLVLATLHTNDAPSAITRLADMGIERFLLSAAVVGVLAQRLCRRLHHCREADPAGGFRPAGCPDCDGGWQGRVAIHELLTVDDRLRELIAQEAPESELRAAWRAAGGRPLLDDGLDKAARGLTTRTEVLATASGA